MRGRYVGAAPTTVAIGAARVRSEASARQPNERQGVPSMARGVQERTSRHLVVPEPRTSEVRRGALGAGRWVQQRG